MELGKPMFTGLLMGFLAITAWTESDFPKDKAVLIYPVHEGGKDFGEPGQIVKIVNGDFTMDRRISVEINGTVFSGIPSGHVFPYDPNFAVSKAYVYLQDLQDRKFLAWSEEEKREDERSFVFARNICDAFPSHPLHEHLIAFQCRFAEKYEMISTDGKTRFTKSIELIKSYLKQYPSGRFKDELEWKLVQLEHYYYEFEGHAECPVEQLKAYEQFLVEHPDSKASHEINLEIARLYRIAMECIIFEPEVNERSGFKKQDAEKFRAKAIEIYQRLLQCTDLKIRETARIDLYNLRHERRMYFNPNEW